MISLPEFKGETYVLKMVKHNIVSEQFAISTSSGENLYLKEGHFYKGKIGNTEDSYVAVSVFEDYFTCSFSFTHGSFYIRKLKNKDLKSANGKYILYDKIDVIEPKGWICHTDDNIDLKKPESNEIDPNRGSPCVDIFFDCDYNYYLDFGGDTV